MSKLLAVLAVLAGALAAPAHAQTPLRSECLAMANAPPRAMPVSLRRTAAKADEVAITYAGHSTYYIDTPGGVKIATDYNGAYANAGSRAGCGHHGARAHLALHRHTDPELKYMMRGWDPEAAGPMMRRAVGDVLIRNVTTDIRG